MFVPMWIVWVVVAVIAAPFAFFGLLWIVAAISYARAQEAKRLTFAAKDFPPVD